MDEKASEKAWTYWKTRLENNPYKQTPQDNIANLSLPRLAEGTGISATTKAIWESQTYEDFAKRVEKRNPKTVFSKKITDAAFRLAHSRMSKATDVRKGGKSAGESMLTRVCVKLCVVLLSVANESSAWAKSLPDTGRIDSHSVQITRNPSM